MNLTKVVALAICFTSLLYPLKTGHAQSENWLKTNVPSNRVFAIETTPWGIMAGENDGRLWNVPYNGIYISRDLGETWSESGLKQRGVTDIEYDNESIYATTYYFEGNTAGLFISRDGGQNWVHVGGNFSASAVAAADNTIVYGGYSHGLWVSKDGGTLWEQKLGNGVHGPRIYEVAASSELLLAATETEVYRSLDKGENWEQLEGLSGQKIENISIDGSVVLAGTSTNDGIFISKDYGLTWYKIDNWTNQSVGGITQGLNKLFVGNRNIPTDVIYSNDFGNTWETTYPNIISEEVIKDMTWLFSEPSYLFVSTVFGGVYRYEIPENSYEINPFLKTPWNTNNTSDIIDKIYSHFDHQYPLNGYREHTEPSIYQDTTLTYAGVREKEPALYYSSHSGYDYTLDYGTPILAAAAGVATYGYEKYGLGNYIEIDHLNGYKTTYAHLQAENLVTKGAEVYVNQGQTIGLVGMTGKTTGPHLHFAVKNYKQSPDNRVDPYAWKSAAMEDPWVNYTWSDINGTHRGSKSIYMWEYGLDNLIYYYSGNSTELALENKKLILASDSTDKNFTIFVEHYAQPKLTNEQTSLTYVTGSSFLANMYDNFGNELPNLLKPIKIEIDYKNADLENIKENSISIYYLNQETGYWERIDSTIDLANKLVTGYTTHFSQFALLGEKVDSYPPITQISITGEIANNWYIEQPTLSFTATDTDYQNNVTTYYSINGDGWIKYTDPVQINYEGRVSIRYRSEDKAGNIEDTKNTTILINSNNKYTRQLVIKEAKFQVN